MKQKIEQVHGGGDGQRGEKQDGGLCDDRIFELIFEQVHAESQERKCQAKSDTCEGVQKFAASGKGPTGMVATRMSGGWSEHGLILDGGDFGGFFEAKKF